MNGGANPRSTECVTLSQDAATGSSLCFYVIKIELKLLAILVILTASLIWSVEDGCWLLAADKYIKLY